MLENLVNKSGRITKNERMLNTKRARDTMNIKRILSLSVYFSRFSLYDLESEAESFDF